MVYITSPACTALGFGFGIGIGSIYTRQEIPFFTHPPPSSCCLPPLDLCSPINAHTFVQTGIIPALLVTVIGIPSHNHNHRHNISDQHKDMDKRQGISFIQPHRASSHLIARILTFIQVLVLGLRLRLSWALGFVLLTLPYLTLPYLMSIIWVLVPDWVV